MNSDINDLLMFVIGVRNAYRNIPPATNLPESYDFGYACAAGWKV